MDLPWNQAAPYCCNLFFVVTCAIFKDALFLLPLVTRHCSIPITSCFWHQQLWHNYLQVALDKICKNYFCQTYCPRRVTQQKKFASNPINNVMWCKKIENNKLEEQNPTKGGRTYWKTIAIITMTNQGVNITLRYVVIVWKKLDLKLKVTTIIWKDLSECWNGAVLNIKRKCWASNMFQFKHIVRKKRNKRKFSIKYL